MELDLKLFGFRLEMGMNPRLAYFVVNERGVSVVLRPAEWSRHWSVERYPDGTVTVWAGRLEMSR